MEYKLTVYTDHYQFYLEAEGAEPDTSSIWNKHASEDMLALGPGIIAVGTARYGGDVTLVIDVLEREPDESLDTWDHVTECSISIPSGAILITSPISDPEDADRITLAPGTYRARIYYGNLDSVLDDGIDMDGDDYYKISLWPSEPIQPAVLKRRQ